MLVEISVRNFRGVGVPIKIIFDFAFSDGSLLECMEACSLAALLDLSRKIFFRPSKEEKEKP